MDKKKQIEEMAKIYEDATSLAKNYLGSMNNPGEWYANAFYNAGYRKNKKNKETTKHEGNIK